MCSGHFCQYIRHGHVALRLVYLGDERFGINILYALINAAVFGNGYFYSYLLIGDDIIAMGL